METTRRDYRSSLMNYFLQKLAVKHERRQNNIIPVLRKKIKQNCAATTLVLFFGMKRKTCFFFLGPVNTRVMMLKDNNLFRNILHSCRFFIDIINVRKEKMLQINLLWTYRMSKCSFHLSLKTLSVSQRKTRKLMN